jgi:hypothetical protein
MTDKARDVFLETGHQRPLFQKQFCSYAGIVQSNLCWKIHNKYVFHINIHIFVSKYLVQIQIIEIIQDSWIISILIIQEMNYFDSNRTNTVIVNHSWTVYTRHLVAVPLTSLVNFELILNYLLVVLSIYFGIFFYVNNTSFFFHWHFFLFHI